MKEYNKYNTIILILVFFLLLLKLESLAIFYNTINLTSYIYNINFKNYLNINNNFYKNTYIEYLIKLLVNIYK